MKIKRLKIEGIFELISGIQFAKKKKKIINISVQNFYLKKNGGR